MPLELGCGSEGLGSQWHSSPPTYTPFVAGDEGVYGPVACIPISMPLWWCLDCCWWADPASFGKGSCEVEE